MVLWSYDGDLHRPHNSRTVVADSVNKMEVGYNENLDCNRDPDQRRVTVYLFFYFSEIEMCTGMFKDQAEVVVAQEEVQEKIDLVENEEELIEEEEQ
ncbi:hypothetical protein Tco_1275867 [Tanacetum coccineum]